MLEIFYILKILWEKAIMSIIALATRNQRWTRQKYPWIYESYNLVGKNTIK